MKNISRWAISRISGGRLHHSNAGELLTTYISNISNNNPNNQERDVIATYATPGNWVDIATHHQNCSQVFLFSSFSAINTFTFLKAAWECRGLHLQPRCCSCRVGPYPVWPCRVAHVGVDGGQTAQCPPKHQEVQGGDPLSAYEPSLQCSQ